MYNYNTDLMGNLLFIIFIAGISITLGLMAYDYKKSEKRHEKKTKL